MLLKADCLFQHLFQQPLPRTTLSQFWSGNINMLSKKKRMHQCDMIWYDVDWVFVNYLFLERKKKTKQRSNLGAYCCLKCPAAFLFNPKTIQLIYNLIHAFITGTGLCFLCNYHSASQLCTDIKCKTFIHTKRITLSRTANEHCQ